MFMHLLGYDRFAAYYAKDSEGELNILRLSNAGITDAIALNQDMVDNLLQIISEMQCARAAKALTLDQNEE